MREETIRETASPQEAALSAGSGEISAGTQFELSLSCACSKPPPWSSQLHEKIHSLFGYASLDSQSQVTENVLTDTFSISPTYQRSLTPRYPLS